LSDGKCEYLGYGAKSATDGAAFAGTAEQGELDWIP